VINTGVEIAPEELPRIFDKFYRIPNNDPWKHGGTGLGLSLVQKLVEQMGGSIEVESANQHTRFTVRLRIPAIS
jgi:signal transduction histidine kinase